MYVIPFNSTASTHEVKASEGNMTSGSILIEPVADMDIANSQNAGSVKPEAQRADSHISEDFDEESQLINNMSLSKSTLVIINT